VNRITEEIKQADEQDGTGRAEGHSLGACYERLGIHLVAMHNKGVPPLHAIRLIKHMAKDASEVNGAALMAMLRHESPLANGVVFLARAEGIN
jgi:hypothetical protein